jgi:NADH-quinone oxidoreductase subunit E
MAEREMKNAPDAAAWVIAAGAGLVALGATIIIGKSDLTPAAFIACLVALVVGLVLTVGWADQPAAQAEAEAEAEPATAPAKVVAPVVAPVAQPLMAAPVSAPAAVVAAAPAEKAAANADGPERLPSPRKGKADDLKEIEGIGPALEKLCNELGFWHFDQIASWSDADVAWVDANMKNFKGRIVRDKWVAQARLIVGEGLEAFRVRAKTNDY